MAYYTNRSNRWLLPDGIEEILPAEAQKLEQLRRCLLDNYRLSGYQLVMPPLLEFTDSLLTGVGNDLDLLTLKITDQLSGRTMGLRPDITPQTARMDAHSLTHKDINRLCYTDYVVHARPQLPQAVRVPFYAGVELFGETTLNADIEVISLLLQSLTIAIDLTITLDLGHVGVYRALAEAADLNPTQEAELFQLLQTKAITDIRAWVNQQITNKEIAAWLVALPEISGDRSILKRALEQPIKAPAKVLAAIDQLTTVADVISARYPQVNLYFDLSELRGYHYHTGIVFAAYVPDFGDAIANGGRYDHIGKAFGRPRPATGFSINLTAIMPLLHEEGTTYAIYAPFNDDDRQWKVVQDLRRAGEIVICGFLNQSPMTKKCAPDSGLVCDRELILEGNEYKVKPLSTGLYYTD